MGLLDSLLVSVFANSATTASSAAATPTLDPATYQEPTEATYWGGSADAQLPLAGERVLATNLTLEAFDRRVLDGSVFVIEDFGETWPMATWDCDFFKTDPDFKKAEIMQQYAKGGGSGFVGFQSEWEETKTGSGAKDKEAPQLAPFYWGIKDVQFDDAHRSHTWKSKMLKKIAKNIKLPNYINHRNIGDFRRTPEFWFAGSGAGAMAHMDTHIMTTISIQLAGTKRWRLGYMAPRQAPFLAMVYHDGDVYKGGKTWSPHFSIELKKGEALFVPPGMVHETLNIGGEKNCTASVTFQFNHPFPSRLYRTYLPRVRRTADIHEAWPYLAELATLKSRVSQTLLQGAPYAQARMDALTPGTSVGRRFKQLDKNGDGRLDREELPDESALDLLGFHDLDEDGAIARLEFAEVYGFWAGTLHQVYQDTPAKFQRFQLEDMQALNIEDLPKKLQKESLKLSRSLEEKLQAGSKRPKQEL